MWRNRVLVSKICLSAIVCTTLWCAAHTLAVDDPEDASSVILWLRSDAVDEFVDLDRQTNVTLSQWIERQNASRELPDQRGHYIFYRHESPEGHTVEYWFGPFDRGGRLDRMFFEMRQLTDRLRAIDRHLYATARVVRVHAPEDDFIRRLSEADREALSLAWVLEKISNLERIELMENRLNELQQELLGAEPQRNPVEIHAAINGVGRQLREAQLAANAAGDNAIAEALFPGESAIGMDAGRRLREELALALVGSHDLGIDVVTASQTGLSSDFLERFANALDAALIEQQVSEHARRRALEGFREYASLGQALSRSELLDLLHEPGQLLLESLADSARVPRYRVATDSLSVADVQALEDAVASHRHGRQIQSVLQRALASDLIETSALTVADFAPHALSSNVRQVIQWRSVQSATQNGRDMGERGEQWLASALGARDADVQRWRNEGTTSQEAQMLLGATVFAFGSSQTAAMLENSNVDADRARDFGMDPETFKTFSSAVGSGRRPLDAAAHVSGPASANGVDVAAAMMSGLTPAAAEGFQEAVERTVRNMLYETMEAGAMDRGSASGASGDSSTDPRTEYLQQLAAALGIESKAPSGTASPSGESQASAIIDAIASHIAGRMADGHTGTRNPSGSAQRSDASSSGLSAAAVNQMLSRVSSLQQHLASRAKQHTRQDGDGRLAQGRSRSADSAAGSGSSTTTSSGRGGSGEPIHWQRVR